MTSRITIARLLARSAARSGPQPAQAQELSGKPIRLLVGHAGGATDVMARLMAQKMSEHAHDRAGREQGRRQFHPGAARATGSPPDGHTLYFISTSSLITQPLHPDYPFDLTKLTPVTQVATGR